MRARILLMSIVVAVFATAAWSFDWLLFPPTKDELHFWPTALRFSEFWFPPIELLRTYDELNTPLPFMMFGWLERIFHGGIATGRWLNVACALAQMAIIIFAGRGSTQRIALACLGLMVFPYFIGVSVHLYTDAIACLFTLAGVWLWRRERWLLCAVAFTFAIASRQYMLAFPASLALFGLVTMRRPHAMWIAPACATLTIVGWILLFGGLAPANEVERQQLVTSDLFRIVPHNALYFLTAVGAWYVVPELILGVSRLAQFRVTRTKLIAVIVGVTTACIVAPPIRNLPPYTIDNMGMFDRGLRTLTLDTDWLRVAIIGALALLPILRFHRWSIALVFVAVNALMMMKAHFMWDKYAMPLIIVLWFLAADTPDTDDASEAGATTVCEEPGRPGQV
jgi:hypothetical protein